MNTAVSADIEGKDAKKVGKAVFDCISELENKLLSRHIETSAVNEINDAAGQSVKITLFSSSANGKMNDPEKKMEDILSKCEELRKSSGGAFDLCSADSATFGDSARAMRECPTRMK